MNTLPTANQQYKALQQTDNFTGSFKEFMESGLHNRQDVVDFYFDMKKHHNESGVDELIDESNVLGFDKEKTSGLEVTVKQTPSAINPKVIRSIIIVGVVIGAAILVAHLTSPKNS